jgi:hypothetical protein
MTTGEKVAVYLICYHSQKPASLRGAERQFLAVERAINDGIWPYDNGDDPSFFVAREGGPLTWGVCRQEVRNSIRVGSIVAFFSFTPIREGQVLYRLSAVTTVLEKQDVRAVYRDKQFAAFRDHFINALMRPTKNGWRYDESDRAEPLRHKDWLWRIADHDGLTIERFKKKYSQVYQQGLIPNDLLESAGLRLAENYILFSTAAEDSYICNNPPEVAVALKGEHEVWSEEQFESLTVGTAAEYLTSGRDYLRVANSSGRNVHRHIRFEMPTPEAVAWRGRVIRALKAADKNGKSRSLLDRLAGAGKCSGRS